MQQVDRLHYEARLAERQFNRVDPDNRLVAAELERRWKAALLELRRVEEALARRTMTAASGPDRIDPRLRAKVVALGQRMPEIWADPSVSREHSSAVSSTRSSCAAPPGIWPRCASSGVVVR